jgi:D-alanyl-D-alanine carboxypeptidase
MSRSLARLIAVAIILLGVQAPGLSAGERMSDAPPAEDTPRLDRPTRQALNRAVDDLLAQVYAPGFSATVTLPGEPPWQRVRGVANIATDRPMRAGLQQRIGSITKTMTASLVLQLVEAGQLSLDDPLSTWYPAFPKAEQVTLETLLNMSSGIGDYSFDPEVIEWVLANPRRIADPEWLIDVGAAMPRAFARPGQAYAYSNTNFILLGRIIENVTGLSYERQLLQRIIRPLGLTRSTLQPRRGGLSAPLTRLYQHQDGVNRDVTTRSLSWGWAAGELASTVDDQLRWAKALGTGHGLLSARMQRVRFRPRNCSAIGYSQVLDLTSAYCLGAFALHAADGELVAVFHTGVAAGPNAFVGYFPRTGARMVLMANGDDPDGHMVTGEFGKLLVAAPAVFGLTLHAQKGADDGIRMH